MSSLHITCLRRNIGKVNSFTCNGVGYFGDYVKSHKDYIKSHKDINKSMINFPDWTSPNTLVRNVHTV